MIPSHIESMFAGPRRRHGRRMLWLACAGCLLSNSVLAAIPPATQYLIKCSGCHRTDGSGSERGGIPDLRGFVGSFGRLDSGRTYLMHVPGVSASGLDNGEIAAVMNYVFERWADAPADDPVPPFSAEEVTRLRAVSVPDVVQARRAVVRKLEARGLPVAPYPWE